MDRRRFLRTAANLGAVAFANPACGGTGESDATSADAGQSGAWTVRPLPALVAGVPAITFNLEPTLPAGVRRGGRFSVSPLGPQLPRGVVLSPSGVLSVTGDATAGVTVGVVFDYDEPA
jgi:hypothetical protein